VSSPCRRTDGRKQLIKWERRDIFKKVEEGKSNKARQGEKIFCIVGKRETSSCEKSYYRNKGKTRSETKDSRNLGREKKILGAYYGKPGWDACTRFTTPAPPRRSEGRAERLKGLIQPRKGQGLKQDRRRNLSDKNFR